MKKIILISLLFISIAAFGQSKQYDSTYINPNLLSNKPEFLFQEKVYKLLPSVMIVPENPVFATAKPDSESTLLRLWEQSGVSGYVTVTFPKGSNYTKATPVNLRSEVTGKPIRIRGGKLNFLLKAYAPASFVLDAVAETTTSTTFNH